MVYKITAEWLNKACFEADDCLVPPMIKHPHYHYYMVNNSSDSADFYLLHIINPSFELTEIYSDLGPEGNVLKRQVIGQHQAISKSKGYGAKHLDQIDTFIQKALIRCLEYENQSSLFFREKSMLSCGLFFNQNVKIAHGWYPEKVELIDILRHDKFRDPTEVKEVAWLMNIEQGQKNQDKVTGEG